MTGKAIVEAAAGALFIDDEGPPTRTDVTWATLRNDTADAYRHHARAAILVALPAIRDRFLHDLGTYAAGLVRAEAERLAAEIAK